MDGPGKADVLKIDCGKLPPFANAERKLSTMDSITVAGTANNIMSSSSSGMFALLRSGRRALFVGSLVKSMASAQQLYEDGAHHCILRSPANYHALIENGVILDDPLALNGVLYIVAGGGRLNPDSNMIPAIRARFEGPGGAEALAKAAALGIFISPPLADVEPWLQAIDDWFATTLMAPRLTRADLLDAVATFHNTYVFLHPQIDVNGRHARAVCSYVLWAHGLPPLVVDDPGAYNAAVSADSRIRGVLSSAQFELAPHANFLAYMIGRLDAAVGSCMVCGTGAGAASAMERCQCGATVVCGPACRKRFAQDGHGAMCAAVAILERKGGKRLWT